MHHNTESLQKMLTMVRDSKVWDPGVPFPTEVEDTGEEYCRVCERNRSAVDGEGLVGEHVQLVALCRALVKGV